MPSLSQVWKRLKTYVKGEKLEAMLSETSLTNDNILHSEKNIHSLNHTSELDESNSREFLLGERLKISILEWTISDSKSGFKVGERQLLAEIYDLLGERALSKEIVEKVMLTYPELDNFAWETLFQRLSSFYQRWCQGEFIDAAPEENYPQQKMLSLRRQNINLGLRQVDIYTGLNVMILLFELHRYAQKQEKLKEKIIFYPGGKTEVDSFFTSQMLRVINYSNAIDIGNFSSILGEFLKGGNFSLTYLGDANLTSVNFSDADLSKTYLGDTNLTGANLSGANLSGAYLGDANLSGANLSNVNFSNADLGSANLSGANLTAANLNRTNLDRTDLSSSDLSYATLNAANLTGADLKDANLTRSELRGTIFFSANLSDAQLSGTDSSGADFCRADLSGADFCNAILKGANLSDAILFNTILCDAVLVSADFSYAKLNGAKLSGATLNDAIFLGAELSGVDLSGINLNDADLSGVNLSDANLSGSSLADAILFGSNLSYANLSGANLSGCNLSGATLNGADLSYCNLSCAILSGADLTDANLENIIWDENQEWEDVRGLDKAVNVPLELKGKS